MFACCQRKDPNALTDNNLIESPRDQSRPLPLDLYTETASDDARKSFLRKACPPYSYHRTYTKACILPSSLQSFSFPPSSFLLSPLYFIHCQLSRKVTICMSSKHKPLFSFQSFLWHNFSLLVLKFFSSSFTLILSFLYTHEICNPSMLKKICINFYHACWPGDYFDDIRSVVFLHNIHRISCERLLTTISGYLLSVLLLFFAAV